ncbi:eIF-2-alpha kinase activator GCN1 [Labeo rohita]|uniref:EIF-2-alpha kinase activator GCN1 n=1 Tax=Labeo rohita TaxID=84645 RepID=A0ABQ8MB48_LABRO|nr:eIF-2-alpha kinase activator GCN1 [Labeo rohita]
MEQGFYSPYFIVPKKGGGLRPILDLQVLNWALHKLPLKMLTQKRIIRCHSYGLRSRVGHGSTGSSPSGCPCPPVSFPKSRRAPLPRYGKDLVLEQTLPRAENLFSRYGVGLDEYDGLSHCRVGPISAELPEFLQRQDGGTVKTISEASGAYGIRNRTHAARIA